MNNVKYVHFKILICFLLLVSVSVSAQVRTFSSPTTGEYSSDQGFILAPGFSTSGPFHVYIIDGLDMPLASAPSQDQNYVRTRTYHEASQTEFSDPTVMQVSEVVQYFDGLGRPLQTVQTKGSPTGKDIVQPIVYDAFGRETVKYLPYTEQTGNGAYKPGAVSTQIQFYSSAGWDPNVVKTSAPYSQTIFEASPLNRVIEQGAPGTTWQPIGLQVINALKK